MLVSANATVDEAASCSVEVNTTVEVSNGAELEASIGKVDEAASCSVEVNMAVELSNGVSLEVGSTNEEVKISSGTVEVGSTGGRVVVNASVDDSVAVVKGKKVDGVA